MRQTLEMALEALERCVATCFDQRSHDEVMGRPEHFVNRAITAIKEALAKPEQEPVVVVDRRLALRTWGFLAQECSPCAHKECQIEGKNFGVDTLCDAWNKTLDGTPTPPQRKPLTDEQIDELWESTASYYNTHDFARAIEAAHGIKE